MHILHSDKHVLHVPGDVMRLGVYRPGRDLPERVDVLREAALAAGHRQVPANQHGLAPIAAVHSPEYLDFLAVAHAEWSRLEGASPNVFANIFPVRDMVGGYPTSIVGRAGYHMHDQLAPIGPGTYEAAVASANLAADAAHRVLAGEPVVYALCRPSGHHAYRDMGGGATYLNNAAIAAQYFRRKVQRVALIDVDVHHGNGTQGIFYHRSDVLFVSLHRDPTDYHPYFVGHGHERGAGEGLGYNLNLPLAAGADDTAYLQALDQACRRIERFVPDALVVSLGLDAHAEDPSMGLGVSHDGFRRIGERLGALNLPTALIQEGGYNIATIGRSLGEFLAGFVARHAVPPGPDAG
ncbi:MAG: histone deacetylase family protein [Rhizobiales bacterium]|nr:histone deacetylase family protein [Hyphomicrobiales bacterium]